MSENLIIIRPSFMKFCKDGCKAAVFNHLLYWIGRKNKDQAQEVIQSGEITYFDTTEKLTKLMANAWSDKKIRTEVNALVEMGLIGRGRNPKWGADRTKHFYFTKEQYTKLIELCKEHQICLAHMELPKEIVNLLAAFDKSIECPCTGQVVNLPYQTENIPNANGKYSKCSDQKQTENIPNANGKYSGAITKVSTKVSKTKISNERMNDASAREVNASTGEGSSHSFIHSSNFSSSSQEETKQTKPEEKPEVSLSAEEQRIHGYWQELGFEADITAKLQEHWSKLVGCVQSLEQFKSLYEYTRQQIENNPVITNKRVNPGNLTKDNNLNGWKQAQEKKNKSATTSKPYGRDLKAEHEKMVNSVLLSEAGRKTAEKLAAEKERQQRILEQDAMQQKKLPPLRVGSTKMCGGYGDDKIRNSINSVCKRCQDSNAEMHYQEAKRLQQEFGLSDKDLGKAISNAWMDIDKYSRPQTMQEFFKSLRVEFINKANEKAATLVG